jgi:hypothetical protein
MSNKKSIEIYFLTEEREKRLWENCIFVFDTSAILNLYYYSKLILDDISKSIFSKLESQERLWIPQRVEYEFFKNREDKITEPIQQYKDLINNDHNNDKKDKNNDKYYVQKIDQSIKHIEQIFNEEIREITVQLNALSQKIKKQDRHPYFEDPLLIRDFQNIITNFNDPVKNELEQLHDIEKLKKAFDTFQNKIAEEIKNKEKEINKNFQIFTGDKDKDPVFKIFNCFQVGEEYSFGELREIAKEGYERYDSEIPPGYKDKTAKQGIRKYGDLIIWKQIIDYANNNQKNIILINNDTKEDWWDKTPKKPKPREELIKEFYDYTNNMEIWMYNLYDFIHKAKQLLGAKIAPEVLEEVKEIEKEKQMQKDKLIVFCEGKTDVIILEFLSERILKQFQINKEIQVISAEGYPYISKIKPYCELFDIDISEIIVVVDGDSDPEGVRNRMLSQGLQDNNLIIISPSIERWLLPNIDYFRDDDATLASKMKHYIIKIKKLSRTGSLDLLLQLISLDELLKIDSSFAKYVNALRS